MKMNIMMLIFSFNIGGIERQLVDMTRVMVQKGHNVSLCIINRDYTESILQDIPDKVTIYHLDKKPGTKNYIPYMKRLAMIIHQNRIQVLHCQGINCVLFAILAKMRCPDLVILNTVHDKGDYSSYSNVKISIANHLLNMTVAISESVRNEILTRNINPSKVTTIYNAVDTVKFQYNTENAEKKKPQKCSAVNQRHNQRLEIGNVARFLPAKKGQDLLVDAVEQLLPKYPGLHCSFAGGIAPGQEYVFQKMKENISARQLDNNFTFLGDITDVPAFLHSLDLFVLPSRYEGFGIALIEAMSCGLPCIASRLDGPEEIISNDRLGVLFAAGDSHALSQAIELVISHPGMLNAEYISDNIRKRFDINIMVQQHLDLYEKLLKLQQQ